MRKLVHEEVDREIANKSVNIAIKMLKPELDQLMKGLREAVQAPVKAAGKAAVNKIHYGKIDSGFRSSILFCFSRR